MNTRFSWDINTTDNPTIDYTIPLPTHLVVEWFHKIHRLKTGVLNWCSWPTMKNPFDLWIYQSLITLIKPDVIIETGSFCGGSALYMAMVCDVIQHGKILSIDNAALTVVDHADGITKTPPKAQHPRIHYLTGDSVSLSIIKQVKKFCFNQSVMVILDSNHAKDHVLKELDAYAPLVSMDSYCIVEDTNINGHPVSPNFGPGPYEATLAWLSHHPEFEVDHSCEEFLLTWNPGGYLRRIK